MHTTAIDLIHLIAGDMLDGCSHLDAVDLEPGPDGDLACNDCRDEWAQQVVEEEAAWRGYVYH
ncbi:hypothetical protein ACGFZP_12845 [Kitasatospora sp. NPDC048239]|uniref:hypothetical protein n=1 Tax=Kitasatospora sp. NPDC048239 TaxID=3364046 RepID=UPI003715E75D